MAQLVIDTQSLCKRFGSHQAIRDLSIQVEKGSIHAFLGPNGSGKTTTIRLLSGLLKPTSGHISVLGHDIPADAERLRGRIGYMTQKFSLYDDLTATENLRFVGEIHAMAPRDVRMRIAELLEDFGLTRYLDTRAANLSGGERQRLSLAAATLHKPEVLFLDEPTSAIDPQSRRDFWGLLFRLSHRGATIMVNTHYMDEALRCHQLGILNHGQMVACDAPDRLIETLDAQVVGVTADHIEEIQSALTKAERVLNVTQIGTRLRVLVDRADPDPVALVQGYLCGFGGGQKVESLHANLEDVFVMSTGLPQ